MASIVDNLVTKVSVQGVANATRDIGKMGFAMQALKGDIKGATASLADMHSQGVALAATGAALTAVGTSWLSYVKRVTAAAAVDAEAKRRLVTAMLATKKGTEESAEGIVKYAEELRRLTGVSDDQIVNAAAMLASFKMTDEEIKQSLPRILDLQQGLKRLGREEMSLEQIAIMLGRAHAGALASLSRIGIIIDENKFKVQGYNAVLEELDVRFRGQAVAAMEGASGSMRAFQTAVEELEESMGEGLLPIMTKGAQIATKVVDAITALNQQTKGAAGVFLLAGGGLFFLAGTLTLITPGISVVIAGFVRMWGWLRRIRMESAATTVALSGQTVATRALGIASATTATTGTLGTLGRATGKFGVLTGLKGLKGLGITLGLGIAGEMATSYGESMLQTYRESGEQDKSAKIKGAIATVGGAALSGAAWGATIGSFIPGVGTVAGGLIGAAGGAIYAGIKNAIESKKFKAEMEKKKQELTGAAEAESRLAMLGAAEAEGELAMARAAEGAIYAGMKDSIESGKLKTEMIEAEKLELASAPGAGGEAAMSSAALGAIYTGVKDGIESKRFEVEIEEEKLELTNALGARSMNDPIVNGLDAIAALLERQNREIIGGGRRTREYIKTADVQRILALTLNRAVA